MDVILAGLNLDSETVAESQDLLRLAATQLAGQGGVEGGADARLRLEEFISREPWTPETLAAAYARISRDARPVNKLRQIARREIEQARKSNERIVFGLGHASVAEHAVFNLDILGISRLAAEFVEHFRLCSFTEKSQRYVTLDGDFTMPLEIMGTLAEDAFLAMVREQNATYFQFYDRLKEYFRIRFPDLPDQNGGERTLDGWAKEDARYCLSLATQTQLGMTANARNIEQIICKAAAHPLLEVREFGERLFRAVKGLAPSLIKYTEPDAWHQVGLPHLKQTIALAAEASFPPAGQMSPSQCHIISAEEMGEEKVLAALAHETTGAPFMFCQRWAQGLSEESKLGLVATLVANLGPHHPLPRAFEYAGAMFECVMSASCFAQYKRHRMGTLTAAGYNPALGITIPPSVRDAGLAETLLGIAERSATVAESIAKVAPAAAPYILTNAHRRRVLFATNLRELTHFMRLRLDHHAQWDIRALGEEMAVKLREHFPIFGQLLCGKDSFAEMKSNLLHRFDVP